MSQVRNIDFLKHARLFGGVSIFLVLASWVLIFTGNLKLGIDFAGGTEALVSVPTEVKVSDSDLQNIATSIGLKEPEIVHYSFQSEDERKGFFIRSTTQRGLIAEKADILRQAIDVEAGLNVITWKGDDQFTLRSDLQEKFRRALQGDLKSNSAQNKAVHTAITALKTSTLSWDKEGKVFKYKASSKEVIAKEVVAKEVGHARVKMWDTSDESGERIRVQFFARPDRVIFDKSLVRAKIVGGTASAENETRSPVFIISADDSVRLKTALISNLKKLGNAESLLTNVEVPRFEKVGATAGQQLRNKGILAVIYALIFILLYIAIRFDVIYSPGAIIALFHDVSITLGLFCILGREFNLPIIAALLAIVGYSLNDTIVVYDRIRENRDQSKASDKFSNIINISVNDCLSRTILTSVTTFLAVLAIKLFGGGIIENFAFAMLVGVIVGTYSSIYIASPVVLAMDDYLERRDQLNAEIEKALS